MVTVAFAFAAGAAWAQSAADPAPREAPEWVRVGTVKQVEGQAWLKLGDRTRAATPGARVQLGERLVTGPGSAARVGLRDGTELSLGPDSETDLSEYAFNATTHEGHLLVRLLQGSMRVVTGWLAQVNPGAFRITTPTTVVGVRGTDFIVHVLPDPSPWQPAAGEFNHDKQP